MADVDLLTTFLRILFSFSLSLLLCHSDECPIPIDSDAIVGHIEMYDIFEHFEIMDSSAYRYYFSMKWNPIKYPNAKNSKCINCMSENNGHR